MNNSAQQDSFGEPAAFGADGAAAGMMQQPGEFGQSARQCTATTSTWLWLEEDVQVLFAEHQKLHQPTLFYMCQPLRNEARKLRQC
jgi:hypothetical protein